MKIIDKIKSNRLLRGGMLLYNRIDEHNVFGRAAELAYYFLFAILPLVIFMVAILSFVNFDIATTFGSFTRWVPADVSSVITNYSEYVFNVRSPAVLVYGIVVSVFFSSAAVASDDAGA